MPSINLLPWREEERKERKPSSSLSLGGAAVGACLVAVRRLPDDGLDGQRAGGAQRAAHGRDRGCSTSRSRRSTASRPTRQRLIARMEVIEKLQRSRPEIVHIFDEIVQAAARRRLPHRHQADRHAHRDSRHRAVEHARLRRSCATSTARVAARIRSSTSSRPRQEQRAGRDVHAVRRPGQRSR